MAFATITAVPAHADNMSGIFTQAPGIVSIARTDATSITVTFTPASDPSVNAYTIILDNGAPAVNNAVSPQLITGLTPDTTYSVQVYGSNGVNTASNINNTIYLPPLAPNTDSALNFTGTGQYAWVADSSKVDFNDTFTAEAWINPATGCATTTCVIFNKGNSVTLALVNNQIEYEIDGNGSAPTSPTWGFVATGISVVDGQWQHIALQKSVAGSSSSGVTVYINGQNVFTGTSYNCTSGCTSTVSNTSRALTIGGLQDTTTAESGKFLGAIDEFRLTNVAFADYAQAYDMQNYSDAFGGEQLHYDFNEGAGSALYNRSSSANGTTDLSVVGSPAWISSATTSVVNKVYTETFRRPYLTSYGGWYVPAGVSAINELIVAGGGAGGFGDSNNNWAAGGGGAGGFVNDTATVTPSTFATLYVGMGEFPSLSACANSAAAGQNSQFNDAQMSGGGQGGCEVNISTIYAPTSGGSGGGGQAQTSNGRNTAIGATASDPTRFGHAGGKGVAANDVTWGSYDQAGGGGGGAGAVGGNGVQGTIVSDATKVAGAGGNAGDGGAGLSSTISGSTVWYAGGGGGTVRATQGTAGSGGTGGGGNGGIKTVSAIDGTAGTGGGGGATSNDFTYAGQGGSGVIILRWTQPLLPLIITAKNTSATYPNSPAASETFTASGNPNSGETFTVSYTFRQSGSTVPFAALVPGTYTVTPCITSSSGGSVSSGCQLSDYSSVTYATGTFNYYKEARTNFLIANSPSAPHASLTGIFGETNTLYVTGTNPGPDTSTSTITYSLISAGSDTQCVMTIDSTGPHIYDADSGMDPGYCFVTATIAASTNYLMASDTQTVLFHKAVLVVPIQVALAGNNVFFISSGPTPFTEPIPVTASDSSTTTTTPSISSIAISGSFLTSEIITLQGSGFWSPGINDIASLFGSNTPISNGYLTVVTSTNPQTITLSIPAIWFTNNGFTNAGADIGHVLIETPSGFALSIGTFVIK